ncbi:MAG: queuosine precursor transporter [Rickettsiaceae bacterium]|nr:queuosine precursor transporter [Rickettsiaceae bacterium]
MIKYKYPILLIALYINFLLLTVSLANRFFEIAGMTEPGGILVFPLAFIILDIVAEVYGYAYSRLFIWIGAASEIIFSLVAVFITHLPSPEYFSLTNEYQLVFDPTIRFVASTLIATIIGEFTNIYFLSKWKLKFQGRSFILRAFCATGLGQLILSIIVDFLAFSGKMTMKELIVLILCGYLWKMISLVIFLFPSFLIINKLKEIDKVDNYDVNVNFNPFRTFLDDGINKFKPAEAAI